MLEAPFEFTPGIARLLIAARMACADEDGREILPKHLVLAAFSQIRILPEMEFCDLVGVLGVDAAVGEQLRHALLERRATEAPALQGDRLLSAQTIEILEKATELCRRRS